MAKHISVDPATGVRTVAHLQPHEERLYIQTDSTSIERAIAAQNAKLRSEGGHKPHVRLHLQMSHQDLLELAEKYPIHAGDPDTRRRAWEQIAKDRPELVAKPFVNKFEGVG